MTVRCPTCGSDVTLVGGATRLRRHVARNAPANAPRAARMCEASGMAPDEAPLRVSDHFARRRVASNNQLVTGAVAEGELCAYCEHPIRPNHVGALRHVYELEGKP